MLDPLRNPHRGGGQRSAFRVIFLRDGADFEDDTDLTEKFSPAGGCRGENDAGLRDGQRGCPVYFRWGRSVAIAMAR